MEQNEGEHLLQEISEKGNGSDIFKMYENKRDVELMVILEFIEIQRLNTNIKKFLNETFGQATLLESFQSYVRYKIEGDAKLWQLFGQMHANQEQLNVAQYSIKQISIEQIFISLADQAEHDD